MEITHVIRGEDHISNTPRQILIFEAFGWRPPVFAHVSLVMGPDHSPLSKRHGATSVAEFRARGYLPEALTNYLALIGWSPGRGRGARCRSSELAPRFRLEDVGHSAGVFDVEKLAWVNRHYLKAAAPERLARLSLPYLQQARLGVRAVGTRTSSSWSASFRWRRRRSIGSSRFLPGWRFCSTTRRRARSDDPALRAEALAARARDRRARGGARDIAPLLDRDAFRAAATRVRERTGQKGKALFHPIRLALTGEAEGLELDLAVPAIERGRVGCQASGITARFVAPPSAPISVRVGVDRVTRG